MAVSDQPNLSCVPRALQGSGSKHGPHTAASIHWEGAGEADTTPPPPDLLNQKCWVGRGCRAGDLCFTHSQEMLP